MLPVEDVQEQDSDYEFDVAHHISYPEAEWRKWLKEPGTGPNTDILRYWAAKQYEYPVVACSARDHLAIPATSAASERVFSTGSDIIVKKRNRLATESLRYLLCLLRSWGIVHDSDESSDDVEG